jgi:hypothetical protein
MDDVISAMKFNKQLTLGSIWSSDSGFFLEERSCIHKQKKGERGREKREREGEQTVL